MLLTLLYTRYFYKWSYQRIILLMIIGHLSSHLIVACPFEEIQIESIICFFKGVSISGMLLFSRNLPESTNSDSVAMSAPLCTFDSLSFYLHSDLLVSMDNLLLSISIDMSLSINMSLSIEALFIN